MGRGEWVWEGVEGVEDFEGADDVVLGGVCGVLEGLEESVEGCVEVTRGLEGVVEVEAEVGGGFGVVEESGDEAREARRGGFVKGFLDTLARGVEVVELRFDVGANLDEGGCMNGEVVLAGDAGWSVLLGAVWDG